MTFNPEAWLAEGLANKDKLPKGVVLPEPEPDYEAWRDRLRAFYKGADYRATCGADFSQFDKENIRGLIAAFAALREPAAEVGSV